MVVRTDHVSEATARAAPCGCLADMVVPALQSLIEAMRALTSAWIEYIESTIESEPIEFDRRAEGDDPSPGGRASGRSVDRADLGRTGRAARIALGVAPGRCPCIDRGLSYDRMSWWMSCLRLRSLPPSLTCDVGCRGTTPRPGRRRPRDRRRCTPSCRSGHEPMTTSPRSGSAATRCDPGRSRPAHPYRDRHPAHHRASVALFIGLSLAG